ncbi:DUF5994 family protein [Amycolatopsis sp. BJA-103]|uniref:DUF5994 family protein n=1 Tax=unclassified Amycolatopsis TaxID=2618356 RepID=UPI000C75831E|nr:DUF5994 family protein [Amycolatopsis sp. BJA-103]AUI57304.1 hypothetical protein BKN51_03135 [Amycolatopsis sp. BJA-103]PNE13267.1 hypothetical protein B1H26_41495 [Amycolatopsis sp. BJA-103]
MTVPQTSTLDHPKHVARLRLKPKAPSTGYVDGAWWPASRDLAAELPSLLVVLAVQLDHIERVTYNLEAWPPAPRRLVVESGDVRLEGFRSQHFDSLTVVGTSGRRRLTLLVVPPETEPELAHHLLMTAAHRDSVDDFETLLASRLI